MSASSQNFYQTPTLCMLCSPHDHDRHPLCHSEFTSPMEAMQPLSIESLSYRWLISIKPYDDATGLSFDANDLSPFIDIDPKVMSLRMEPAETHDFTFSLSTSQQQIQALIDADEIICDGFLLPLQVAHRTEGKKNKPDLPDSSDSVLRKSVSVDSSRVVPSLSKRHMIHDSHGFPSAPISQSQGSSLMLLRQSPEMSRVRSSKKGGGLKLDVFWNCGRSSKRILKKYLCCLTPLYEKVKDLRSSSARLRKRRDGGLSSIDSCRPMNASYDVGVEKSIHEAILYCKKSNGML